MWLLAAMRVFRCADRRCWLLCACSGALTDASDETGARARQDAGRGSTCPFTTTDDFVKAIEDTDQLNVRLLWLLPPATAVAVYVWWWLLLHRTSSTLVLFWLFKACCLRELVHTGTCRFIHLGPCVQAA